LNRHKTANASPFLPLRYPVNSGHGRRRLRPARDANYPARRPNVWQRTEWPTWVQCTMKYLSIRAWLGFGNRHRDVRLVPEYGKVEIGSGPDDQGPEGGLGASPDRLAPPHLFQRAAKRAFDIAVSIVGLMMFSPMLLLASLAVRLDSRGSIISHQICHRRENETFRIFKFRCTTIENIDLAGHAAGNRATRIGRILRLAGIDGLPQLINVLRGEMSIVGPGPCPIGSGANFGERTRIAWRHDLKPGLTGWAQVNGYKDVGNSFKVMRRRTEYDLYYAENWSFLLDVKIILMTLRSSNSYLPIV